MIFDAVIFDFDGVLVDSEPLHEWAILASLQPRGWTCSREQFYQHIVGRGDDHAYLRLAEWNNASISREEIDLLLRRKWELMAQGIAQGRFAPHVGAPELVRHAARLGPVGLCSGSVGSTVRPILERLDLLKHFSSVVTGDLVAQLKPDPEGYLRAARELGVDPRRCLAIEDTPTGVKAARAAGIFTIAVAHTVPPAMLHEADQVLMRIADVRL